MHHDSHLQKAVLTALNWDPGVIAAHIGVTANDGVVTLTGHVPSYAQKQAAEIAASQVKGVKAVAQEIEVRLPSDARRMDEDIAAAAVSHLTWDVRVPRDAVKVTVEKGWITLTGVVESYYQKDAAAQDVHSLLGALGLTNRITIKPKVDVSNVSDDILHALHRSWFFDPKTIEVTADGSKVRLTGTVESLHERQVAAATAWAAPGVTDVENDLAVV